MPAIRWSGLRLRIIGWSFIPTAIILAAVAMATFWAYQQVTRDLVEERNQELARLSAGDLAAGLNTYSDLLATEARTIDPLIGNQAAAAAALAGASNRMIVFDAGVVVLNQRGVVVASLPERPEIARQDWSARSWFRQMVRVSDAVLSDILPDGPAGAPVVLVAVPITGMHGEFQGALAGMFRIDRNANSAFYGGIVKLRIGRSSTYVVDSTGRVIFHTDASHIGESFAGQKVVQQVLAGQVGNIRTTDLNGQAVLAGFASIPGTPWGLVTEESWSALMNASRGYRGLLTGLLGLGILVPVLVLAFGIHRITQPIEELKTAAQEVAGGNFDKRIHISTGDELEELADQFNLMAERLSGSYANLEERVAARTRELATLNAIANVVNSSLDLHQVLESALEQTIAVTHMDQGQAYRLEEDPECAAEGGCLVLQAARGVPEDQLQRVGERIPLSKSLARFSLAKGSPVVVAAEDYPDEYLRQVAVAAGLRVMVSIPVMSKGRPLGALTVSSLTDRTVSAEERVLLGNIGVQVGIAVENARLYAQAEEAAAMAERSRLARDLHDAVTQTLFSASLIAEVLPRLFDRSPDEARRRLSELRQLTRGALAEMRTLLLELRPSALGDIALVDLVRQLADSTIGRARVPVTVSVEGEPVPLGPDVKIVFYRIAQESLNNIAKHSGATAASISVHYFGLGEPGAACGVELSIRDDGHGFDPQSVTAEHMGLRIMRERAEAIGATFVVRSQPGVGTETSVGWVEPSSST